MFYNIFLDIHQKGGLHNKDFDRNIRRFGRGWTSCHMFIEFSIYNMVYISELPMVKIHPPAMLLLWQEQISMSAATSCYF